MSGGTRTFLTGLEPLLGLGPLAVDPQLALSDDPLDVGEGELREARDEEAVDPHPGLVGIDLKVWTPVASTSCVCALASRRVGERSFFEMSPAEALSPGPLRLSAEAFGAGRALPDRSRKRGALRRLTGDVLGRYRFLPCPAS